MKRYPVEDFNPDLDTLALQESIMKLCAVFHHELLKSYARGETTTKELKNLIHSIFYLYVDNKKMLMEEFVMCRIKGFEDYMSDMDKKCRQIEEDHMDSDHSQVGEIQMRKYVNKFWIIGETSIKSKLLNLLPKTIKIKL